MSSHRAPPAAEASYAGRTLQATFCCWYLQIRCTHAVRRRTRNSEDAALPTSALRAACKRTTGNHVFCTSFRRLWTSSSVAGLSLKLCPSASDGAGDSITEQWRGTIYGNPCDRPGCPEGPDIFKRYFGQWRSAAFAISGTARSAAGARRFDVRSMMATTYLRGETRGSAA